MTAETFTGFIPSPDLIVLHLGPRCALVYGAIWRLAQQSNGARCVAPIRQIGILAGHGSTLTALACKQLVRRGYIRRDNGFVIERPLLDLDDPALTALVQVDRAARLGRCVSCDRPATTLDHIVPRSLGGADTIDNLQPMCAGCNADKGVLTMDEWIGCVP